MATITSPRAASPAIPSGTNTPSSSTRLSSDLPRTNIIQQSSSTTANPPSQRRNRAALRDYYNLKSRQTGTTTGDGVNSPTTSPSTSTQTLPNIPLSRTASVTSTTSNSTSTTTLTHDASTSGGAVPTLGQQLDDPTFDADSYISTLLRTSSLRDILRTESSLVSEIRNLDGERKALVYDNYSKLIKAVGTIGEMQRGMEKGGAETGLDGVKDLETRLDGLIEGLGDFSAAAVQHENNDENRGGQRKKNRRNDRKKQDLVRWVLNAPDRLQGMEREAAKKEWDKVKDLLDKWEGVKGIDEVRSACERVMKEDEDENENENDSDRPSTTTSTTTTDEENDND